MRAVAGVLYELYYRSMVNSWPPYVFAEGVDIDFISKVKEQGLSGVEIEAATVRTYNTEYAAHLLGRVGAIENWDAYKDLDLDGDGTPDYEMDDTVGKEGAELAFESYLRGTAGVREVERNTSGKVVSEKWTTAPSRGTTWCSPSTSTFRSRWRTSSPRLFPSWPVRTQRAQPAW